MKFFESIYWLPKLFNSKTCTYYLAISLASRHYKYLKALQLLKLNK